MWNPKISQFVLHVPMFFPKQLSKIQANLSTKRHVRIGWRVKSSPIDGHPFSLRLSQAHLWRYLAWLRSMENDGHSLKEHLRTE